MTRGSRVLRRLGRVILGLTALLLLGAAGLIADAWVAFGEAPAGPFAVTLFEVGAYDRAWPDWHLGPEQALRAHRMTRGDLFLPIHWGLWSLANQGWTEPVERVLAEAERREARVFVPRPGQTFEPASLPPSQRWWPDVPWQTAAEHPIQATLVPPELE